jgi:pescadillo protein
MMTFLELYQTVLGFVLFRLYHEINLNYPPKLDSSKDDAGAGIGALLLEETSRTLTIQGKKGTEEGLQKDGKKVSAKDVKKQIRQITHHSVAANGTDVTVQEDIEGDSMVVETTSGEKDVPKSLDESEVAPSNQTSDEELTNIFSEYYFYLSREVTRPTLEFVIRSFGGQVGWDATLGAGSPYNIDDPRITHHIIDRPVPVASSSKGSSTSALVIPGLNGAAAGKRAYIQPQWVVDCINLRKILPTDQYAPGKVLPPHLSPFVDYDQVRQQGGYIPTEAGGEAVELSEDEDEEEDEEVVEDEEEEEEAESSEMDDGEEEFSGFVGEEDEDAQPRPALLIAASNPDDASLMHQAELEAESHGVPHAVFESELAALKKTLALTKGDSRKMNKAAQEAASHSAKTQEANPASILLSNKQRKLYNKMKFGENKRNAEADKLKEKKKAITKQEKKRKA